MKRRRESMLEEHFSVSTRKEPAKMTQFHPFPSSKGHVQGWCSQTSLEVRLIMVTIITDQMMGEHQESASTCWLLVTLAKLRRGHIKPSAFLHRRCSQLLIHLQRNTSPYGHLPASQILHMQSPVQANPLNKELCIGVRGQSNQGAETG